MSQENIEIGSISPKSTKSTPDPTPYNPENKEAPSRPLTPKPPSNTLILCELLLYMGTKPCEQDQEYFASKTKLYEILDYIQKQFGESYMNIQLTSIQETKGKQKTTLYHGFEEERQSEISKFVDQSTCQIYVSVQMKS